MNLQLIVYFLISNFACLDAKESPYSPSLIAEGGSTWQRQMRATALEGVDKMLEWSLQERSRDYILEGPSYVQTYRIRSPDILNFVVKYGYFSVEHPIVGRVTTDPKDMKAGEQLLVAVSKGVRDPELRALATAEVLAKVICYRDLKKGMEISIPSLNSHKPSEMNSYVVDEIFDLWYGMPALALVPKNPVQSHSLLLFRGTDFSLSSIRGWASLMSDVDTAGPGLNVFRKAQPQIHAWLQKQAEQNCKAQVIGFSLGGALAVYTAIYEGELLHELPAIAFNAPGVSAEVAQDWQKLPDKLKNNIAIYVTKGDVVSKVGRMCGEVYEFSSGQELRPIAAHVTLMTCESKFFLSSVNVVAENLSRQ